VGGYLSPKRCFLKNVINHVCREVFGIAHHPTKSNKKATTQNQSPPIQYKIQIHIFYPIVGNLSPYRIP